MLSAALIKNFDGTQPTFTQVPPNGKPSLMINVFRSNSSAVIAAEKAAEPPPMINKSYFLSKVLFLH